MVKATDSAGVPQDRQEVLSHRITQLGPVQCETKLQFVFRQPLPPEEAS